MNTKQKALLEQCELCDTNGAVNGQVNDVVWIENRKALTAWAKGVGCSHEKVAEYLILRRLNPGWRDTGILITRKPDDEPVIKPKPATQQTVKPAPIETPTEPVKTQPRGAGGFYDSLGESYE